MKMYVVFTENTDDRLNDMWLVMANDEEEAKANAIVEGEFKSWGKYTATKVVFLRESCASDTKAMKGAKAQYLYSWERE